MKTRKRLVLNDGVTLSVQANQFGYCTPREDDAVAYSHIEIGFVEPTTAIPDSWAEWAEISTGDNWKDKNQVFAYMPANVLLEFVMEHGGIASGEIPPLAFFGEPSMAGDDNDE